MLKKLLGDNRKQGAAIAGGAAVAVFVLAALVLAGARADFILLTAALLTLCGVVVFDIASRRRWENEAAAKLRTLSSHHDRLVREVARSRNDIGIMKEGLGKAAQAVEKQGRALQPSSSAEAQMIQTIVQQLGAIGDIPRAGIEMPAAANADSQILELELSPPPAKAPPVSALDEELSAAPGKINDSTMIELLHHAVRNDAIAMFLQPIVGLPQRKARLYEAFARIRGGAGVWLPASRYMDLALREELATTIDNLLLLRCLQVLRDDKALATTGAPVIVNVTAATLQDKGFMGDLVTFLSQHRGMASRLVFELPQEDITGMALPLIAVMNGLAKLGCKFSMDRVRQRRIDVALLKSRHIRYIKMDASWLAKEGASREGFLRVIRLKRSLDAAGIDLIAEKVESESALRSLLDYGIDLGQGWLFGKPDNEAAFRKPTTKKAA